MGHVTPGRTAFVSAVMQALSSDGLVYLPPIRPYRSGTGITEQALVRILAQTDLYLWTSHNPFLYHEGFRALDAVKAGAIPVRIDPIHHGSMTHIPWVYPHLAAFLQRLQVMGPGELHATAARYIKGNGTIGGNILTVLGENHSSAASEEASVQAQTMIQRNVRV
jgi:hypothetical protein